MTHQCGCCRPPLRAMTSPAAEHLGREVAAACSCPRLAPTLQSTLSESAIAPSAMWLALAHAARSVILQCPHPSNFRDQRVDLHASRGNARGIARWRAAAGGPRGAACRKEEYQEMWTIEWLNRRQCRSAAIWSPRRHLPGVSPSSLPVNLPVSRSRREASPGCPRR